jgi:hypothetical protein
MKRDSVLKRHDRRLAARDAVLSDAQTAKSGLSPRNLWRHWGRKQLSAAQDIADETLYGVRKNAGLLGAIGAGVLLIAAREPISRTLRKIRAKVRSQNIPSTSNEQDPS